MTFGGLVDLLPKTKKLAIASSDGAVTYVEAANRHFVPPELDLKADRAPSGTPSVVLIAAPAAVGKTTLAAELAYRSGSPIWDLARFHVGNDFFVGTLASHFGYDNLGRVFESFENGTGCVILDAVDETQLRSGPRNFDAFLEDLARAHQTRRLRPSLVLLARPITSDLVALALEVAGVEFRHYEVAFFGESAAKGLIDAYLDDEHGGGPHRTDRKPFEEFREALLGKVFAALGYTEPDWNSERAQRFLGYAPVLAAIASYLDVPNYKAAVNEIRSRRVPDNLWEFLAGLVKTVLQREKKKTLAGIRPALQATADRLEWSGWDGLYREDEQCARVLARVSGKPVDAPLAPDVPAAFRPEYEEALRDWLENHAFCRDSGGFANVVFQDYVYAHALAGGRADLSKIVREILSSEALPSPLLGAFLLTLAPKSGSRRLPVIDALDVGSLYDSMQSFSTRSDSVSLDLAVTEVSGIGIGVARFPATAGEADPSNDLKFEFLTGSSPVRFGQQLSSAIIDLDTDVELGYAGRLMVLGPDVVVICRELRVSAAAYRVDSAKAGSAEDDAAVALVAQSLQQGAAPELKVFGDNFTVQVEDVSYPWAPYRRTPETASIPNEHWEAYSRMKKILVHFRAHGKGDLARYADFVDNVLIGKSAVGKAVLNLLLGQGLIERRGDLYVLSRERMREFGIHRSDLIQSRMTDGVMKLLSGLPPR